MYVSFITYKRVLPKDSKFLKNYNEIIEINPIW